jgi:aminoglycoside/choline kinase family phosphotransferase
MRITETDLQGFLKQCFSRDVGGFALERLQGDASDRNYYRLRLGKKETPHPETVVVMELQTPFPGEELPFVNILHALETGGLAVPGIYGVESRLGLVLLEDLGDELLQDRAQETGPHRLEALYREALDMIIAMQCDFVPAADCVAFSRAFTAEKFVWELEFFRLHYVEGLLGRKIHGEDRDDMDRLFGRLSSLMAKEKKVFTHRDFHSRNLIHHDGELKMLDFQDARMGPPHYDVASLLRDSYVSLADDIMEVLLEYYISEKEGRTGERIDRRQFRYLFDITSLQRNMKAIGTFAYQAVERRNPAYLRYIPITLGYVRKNLDRYETLASHREVLARYLPFDEC